MGEFYNIVVADYKQRTRSYAFLVTLAISLYFAYSFVPLPNADYTTVRIGNYIGVQNSAWMGYVTAMMSSVFLCMVGFYLINSGIKKDIDTGVGMIIATTSISNFKYLLAKTASNFLVLLSITAMVFLMSITVFFIRSAGYPFQITQFILPYLIITVPTIFFVAALAVVAEVFLYRYTILMNIGYFFFFAFMMSQQLFIAPALDIFGVKPVTVALQETIKQHYDGTNNEVSMGFIFGHQNPRSTFVFKGITWTASIIGGRLLYVFGGLLLVLASSGFFHRFDIKQKFKTKIRKSLAAIIAPVQPLHDIRLSALPAIVSAYGISPFIKAELLMLIRKGPHWLWLINFGGMVALALAPLPFAHQMVLPGLWFLQVARWSDLATKEKTNRIHYFSYASYKPLTRLLPAQILAGIILALALASPLWVRCLISGDPLAALNIIMGGVFIVLFAVASGMLTGGKKLFEILFFLITYANIEQAPFADYFGGMHSGLSYTVIVAGLIGFFVAVSFLLRKMEIRSI
jgi:hypothetical protein